MRVAAMAVAIVPAACGATRPLDANGPGGSGAAGTGPGIAGAGGDQAPPPVTCTPLALAPRRLVRLTFDQSASAVRSLLGDDAANRVVTDLTLGAVEQRTFPPLNGPREGVAVIPSVATRTEQLAADGGQYVYDHFAEVTGCPADGDCVSQFIAAFAERAYRRPLTPPELESLDQLISDELANGASVQEVAQYGVYGVLMAPEYLYRTELGDPSLPPVSGEVALTPYEAASAISFFLTDGPPDAQLLAAARQGTLATDAGVAAEVTRLLATDGARRNLETAMSTLFKVNLLGNVVIDPVKVPEWSTPLENAMTTEAQLFLHEVLWQGSLGDVLTSRASYLNTDLATIVYGLPVPVGATATDFVRVELPDAQRAGLLTRAAFITSRARTDIGSIVARALVISEVASCDVLFGAPITLAAEEVQIINMLSAANATPREEAEARLTRPECSSCHALFDPYGLALDSYDVIGRFRTQYGDGRPIDTSATLPPAFDNQQVRDAVEMSQKLAESRVFATCTAKNMLQYALSDATSAPVDVGSCPVAALTARFLASTDRSFSELISDVMLSPAALRRSAE
jgi:hypothetical protein